jgi:hypothetical protein
MTIYEIKRRYESANPEGHFFDRAAMKFFQQTLRDFRVKKISDGVYQISAPMPVGESKRIWREDNPGTMESVVEEI